MKKRIPLEQAAVDICNASSIPPRIYQLPPAQGRQKLNEAQDSPVFKYPANISSVQIRTRNGFGTFPLYCVYPENITGIPDVIFYMVMLDKAIIV